MNNTDALAQRFERERPRLRALAYRMLGTLAAADDWLHSTRSTTVAPHGQNWPTVSTQ